MDDQLTNRQKEILQRLLADPADIGAVYLSNLQDLVKAYPQSGLFRALYGRAVNESSPLIAGGYFDSRALHKLLFYPTNIAAIPKEKVIFQNGYKKSSKPAAEFIEPVKEIVPESVVEAKPIVPEPVIEPAIEPIAHTLPGGFPDILKVSHADEPKIEPAPVEVIATPEPVIEKAAIAEPETLIPEPIVAAKIHYDEPLGRAPWELEDDLEEEPAKVAHAEPVAAPIHIEPVAALVHEEVAAIEPIAEEPVITHHWEAEPTLEHIEEEPLVAAAVETYPHHEYISPAPVVEEVATAVAEDDVSSRLAYWRSIEDEYDAPAMAKPANEVPFYVNEDSHIHDYAYDEVTSINHNTFVPEAPSYAEVEAPAEPVAAPVADEAEHLIMGNIASTDFFTFDRAFGEKNAPYQAPRAPEPAAPQRVAKPAPQAKPRPRLTLSEENTTHHDVSKYHDDKMPYSFMWWLDKTRKEHGSLYQPYTQTPETEQQPARKPGADELQQQYYANIFQFSSAEEFSSDPTADFDMHSKEDRIIQRFIKEDPHIHPPVGEKLDTENKAKKSSEDSDIMVTETLARIYADQMLFPKAVATYKKLMLKFPEKSRYFASRIENLEKKNN